MNLLSSIYGPRHASDKFREQLKSGNPWSCYFKPWDITNDMIFQKESKFFLEEIDEYRKHINVDQLTKLLIPSFANQYYRENSLKMQVASKLIIENTFREDDDDARIYHEIISKNDSWEPGKYRHCSIRAKDYPLIIYPYPLEIPSLMREFYYFKDCSRGLGLHPIVAACHLFVSFHSIHPFQHGNGQVAQLIFMEHLVQHGYPPVVHHHLNYDDLVDLIRQSQQGSHFGLYFTMVETIMNELIGQK